MKYLGAYMLAQMGGKDSPSADDIKKILDSVGAEYDEAILTKVLGELSGKNVASLIEQGKSKLSSVPSGGAPAAAGGAPAEEEKKEEVKEESESEEEEEEIDFDLFD